MGAATLLSWVATLVILVDFGDVLPIGFNPGDGWYGIFGIGKRDHRFPIYGSQKTFRHALFEKTTGGFIRREGTKNQRVTVRALENISLNLSHGDRLGMIGHNGAGKSTLLRVCAGVYEPTYGKISINGKVSPLFSTSPGLDGDDTGYENIQTCGMFLE